MMVKEHREAAKGTLGKLLMPGGLGLTQAYSLTTGHHTYTTIERGRGGRLGSLFHMLSTTTSYG